MTALTVYFTETAATTVSTADTILANASTGGSLSNKNTNLTSGTTGWVEIWSQGNASAQTGAGSQPSPTGHGWLLDSTLLEGNTLSAGTWTVSHPYETTTTGTFTADFHYGFYQRSSGGTYTLIGEATVTGQSIVSTSFTTITATGSLSASNQFATGDKLYIHVTMNISTNGTTGNMRMQASTSSTLGNTSAQVVTPGYTSVTTSTRTVPATAALQATLTRTVPDTVALSGTFTRTVPDTVALQGTFTRTVPAIAAMAPVRTIPASAALLATLTRTVPALAALTVTSTRTIPTSAALYQPSVFYASNVAQTAGGLTQSDQMSQIFGGTETSVTVTMPASGTNSYVELLAQGGSSSGTSALPAPTGKGWSISLAGNTILAGSWFSTFTLAKSGTSKTGASLIVRWYRRTMDGVYYSIGTSTLSSQTFSTTKTSYTVPTITVNFPWQFVTNDTLYVDCFVFNASTAWASDVFTVYVSNSATMGVVNDGVTTAPTIMATSTGLTCLVGASSFQTGSGFTIKNESFTLADMIDQRSVLTLTAEDPGGNISFTPNMPVILSDSNQGKIYDGYLASDKMSKVSADPSILQREHQLTFADHHRDYDKEANGILGVNTNGTNYLNWTAGDISCDFIDKVETNNGIWGEYAIEADYTQAAFALGTLSGTTATSTTSPFTYAPNTSSPPVTTNTGDLELTRAGTQFMLTETTTSDFASGTLTNMAASSNALSPTTQSAVKVTAELALSSTMNLPAAGGFYYNPNTNTASYNPTDEFVGNWAYVQIWAGSKVIGSNDTFNYDLWIASTSPECKAGVDFICTDGTELTLEIGSVDVSNSTGLFDQNNLSVDALVDLTNYAKDQWYTRNIALTGLNGKTINSIYVFVTGETNGYYTVYAKNIYLSSASGSPFFSTSATSTQLNPPTITVGGNYIASAVTSGVVSVYRPALSSRVSPAHSISGVGLVQNSTVSWTASLPTNGPSVSTAVSPYITTTIPPANTAPSLVLLASYDNTTWLPCANNEPLPGLPAGANVSGLSLYLQESFAAGSDPSAIPSLLQVNVTINSAAAQTTSDIVTTYGNATEWNSGTYSGTGLNSNNDLTQTGTYSHNWSSHTITGQVFSYTTNVANASESASSGAYVMTVTPTGTVFAAAALSRLDFTGISTDFTVEFDFKLSNANNQNVYGAFVYRGQGLINPITTTSAGGSVGGVCFNSGNSISFANSHIVFTPFSGGSIFENAFESIQNPHVTVSQSMSNNTTYHVKLIVKNNRHTLYFNNASTPVLDIFDNTVTGAGGMGFLGWTFNGTSSETYTFDNFTMTPMAQGTWTSPSTSLTSLGTCGNTEIVWNEETPSGAIGTTAAVLSSIDNGTTWQQCTNGSPIPGLASGTNVSGKNLIIQILLYSSNIYASPIITGLYARVCGSYGTVSGTRISPALSLTPVGYVASSNVAYHANIPTNTSVTIQTTQDLSTYHTVGNSGAGEALTYWTNQPAATQDLFNTVTSANYTNTSKSGGSAATASYDTTNSRITLSGGSGALYLNSSISTSDVDLLCDMDESDAGGLCWREVDTSNFYELGVYDASSSGGFTNQLRLYKVASGTRTLLGSASSITFTRGTFHRVRVKMKGGLINVYWDGACQQSYLDTSPLGSGKCGLRNDGGTSRYYQLWILQLGTNLSGQVVYTKATLTTSDPAYMPQLFTLLCCVRGPSIGTGATVPQLHPVTLPFAAYLSAEMDAITQQSGDYYWYVDKWRQFRFGARSARPGAFPLQSAIDPAQASGYLLYQPAGAQSVTVTNSADPLRNQQIITNVYGLVTPPTVELVADGNTTSWTLGYPVYSAPIILVNNQPATVGLQGVDSGKQFYWQPASTTINYDSTLPKLPSGTVIDVTYVGQSTINTLVSNSAAITAQAALELNSGNIAEIESALTFSPGGTLSPNGMTDSQAQTFAQGLLNRFGFTSPSELIGTTLYGGLVPGTVIQAFINELGLWNVSLPIVKVTTTAFQGNTGIVYLYSVDCTSGANQSSWARVWF